jgi:hypothetical protein
MFIPDPDIYPSRIPDLGSRSQKQQQKRGVKKNSCHTFLWSHKFHKIENYFTFEMLKKKILGKFSKNYRTFNPKIVTKLSNIWFGIRDPGSGKNLFRIPDPGVKKALDPRFGSTTLLVIGTRYLVPGLALKNPPKKTPKNPT